MSAEKAQGATDDSPLTTDPIPMTVIGGFLGAGKTSYLNALIQAGLEPGALILVNDFGDINIDSALITYQDDRVISLTNGCICCTLGGTLAEQLAEALRFAPRPTAIYIEASGVAEPARIADIARVSRQLRLAEVVCLVDASQALTNVDHPHIGAAWKAQVRAADRLLINRQVADPDHRARVAALFDTLNPTAERVEIPLHENVPAPEVAPPAPRFVPTKGAGGGHPWSTVTLSLEGEVDPEVVDRLLGEHADVVVRAKGFLRCRGHADPRLLQFSGRRALWQAALRPPVPPRLVLIGLEGPRFTALCRTLDTLAGDA